MNPDPRTEEGSLVSFFDAVRAEPVSAEPRFLAAVLADAERLLPGPQDKTTRRPASLSGRGSSLLSGLLDAIGGWRGAAAMAGCAVVGFWFGASGTGPFLSDPAYWTGAADLFAVLEPMTPLYELALEDPAS